MDSVLIQIGASIPLQQLVKVLFKRKLNRTYISIVSHIFKAMSISEFTLNYQMYWTYLLLSCLSERFSSGCVLVRVSG